MCLSGPAAEELFCGPITDDGDRVDYEMARHYLADRFDRLRVEAEITRRAAARPTGLVAFAQERLLSRPNWSRPLPRPLKIPSVMTLKTLADVRELVERRLPDGHRQRSTWQHVEKQLNAAALGEVETIDVAVPLRLVLQLERVPCLPQ